jgi:uncharacterized protein (UPF0548 family)
MQETEWRFGRGWNSEELKVRMTALAGLNRNFDVPEEELTVDHGWHHWYSEAVIAHERPHEHECFERASVALANYQFSDPDIVLAHFDPATELLGRRIMLEIKVFGLHYLCPALVTRVRDEDGTVFGFRYDTLIGHMERGLEWFLLTKSSDGEIRFRIEAMWQRGELPNWWSRIGFAALAGHYQRKWHRQAHRRLSMLAHFGSTAMPPTDYANLAHQGIDVEGIDVQFVYHDRRKKPRL